MDDLLTFLDKSPSRYHAVENFERELISHNYTRLCEGNDWPLHTGGKYYVIRNGSALIAFRIPEGAFPGFMISASHSDSPSFRVKENAELDGPDGYIRLNTEPYGGMLCAPWLDRPLTVAGRAMVRENDRIVQKTVYVDKDLLIIPNLALHMNRDANNGFKFDFKCDMVPLMGLSGSKGVFRQELAAAAGCATEDILGTDLFLCPRQKALNWGAKNEFISSPRLDDLQCAYACFRGFLDAGNSSSCPVFALLDNEEVGSLTRQGADGTFLQDSLIRVCAGLGSCFPAVAANSFLVSADNAHAVHPNHPEFSDPTHRPLINGGIVIKHGVRYATDGAAQAVFSALCQKIDVPTQHFSNRSDLSGGSTLGNIANAHVSMSTVDIGLAQLAMHSCFETAGSEDTNYLIRAMTAFYTASYQEGLDGIIIR